MTRHSRRSPANPTRSPSHRARQAATANTHRAPAGATRERAWSVDGLAEITPGQDRFWTVAAWALVAAFLAGLAAMMAGPHRVGDYFTETDFYGAYAEGARLVQHGQLLPSRYGVIGPIYEIVLAIVGFVIRDLFVAAELLSAFASAVVMLAWFRLLRHRLDARHGAIAVLFIASNAFFFRFGFAVTTDALGNALQAVALLALLGAAEPRDRRNAVAGVLSALAFLTRYNAIYLLPAGWIAIAAGGTGTPSRRRSALVFTAGFLALVIPWVAYSLAHGGTFSFALHHNIAYEVFARSKGIAWDDYQKKMQSQFPTLMSVIARDPPAVMGHIASNVLTHMRDDALKLLGGWIAIAAAIGLVMFVRSRRLRVLWPLLIAGALLFLTLVPVFYSERYSLALLPFYASLAAVPFASPRFAFAIGGSRSVWLKPVLAVWIVSSMLPAFWQRQRFELRQLPYEVVQTGRVLRELKRPGDRIIARKPHVAYYGQLEPLAFPFADSLPQLARFAHEQRARWLFVSWPEVETRPAFWYLLDTTGAVPGLTPRYTARPRPAVLYEIGPEFGTRPAWFADDTLRLWHTLRGRTLVEPTNAALQARYGWLSWWLGHMPEAREALLIATERQPNVADPFVTLGRVQLALRDPEAARVAFEQASRLEPRNAQARIGLGMAAVLTGRTQEAAAAWRDVIPVAADPRVLGAMVQLYDSMGDRAAADAARERLAQERRP